MLCRFRSTFVDQTCTVGQQLGFVARGEKLGRGKDGALLTTWWYSHGHPSLFTLAEDQLSEFKFKVVMDANIFFALTETGATTHREAQALLADWLQDDVSLCLTPEIMNEIDRNNSPAERKKQRTLANTFKTLPSSDLTVQNYKRKSRSIFPREMSPSDESDLAQLAYAMSGGAHFFITRDAELLSVVSHNFE